MGELQLTALQAVQRFGDQVKALFGLVAILGTLAYVYGAWIVNCYLDRVATGYADWSLPTPAYIVAGLGFLIFFVSLAGLTWYAIDELAPSAHESIRRRQAVLSEKGRDAVRPLLRDPSRADTIFDEAEFRLCEWQQLQALSDRPEELGLRLMRVRRESLGQCAQIRLRTMLIPLVFLLCMLLLSGLQGWSIAGDLAMFLLAPLATAVIADFYSRGCDLVLHEELAAKEWPTAYLVLPRRRLAMVSVLLLLFTFVSAMSYADLAFQELSLPVIGRWRYEAEVHLNEAGAEMLGTKVLKGTVLFEGSQYFLVDDTAEGVTWTIAKDDVLGVQRRSKEGKGEDQEP